MGKIGSLEYPDIRLSECLSIAKIIQDRFAGQVKTPDALASALGHSTVNSGGFRAKITALQRWGLTQGRGEIILTDNAITLLSPRDANEEAAIRWQILQKIDIFRQIYQRLQGKMPDENLWIILLDISQEPDRSLVRAVSATIRNLYIDAFANVKPQMEVVQTFETKKQQEQGIFGMNFPYDVWETLTYAVTLPYLNENEIKERFETILNLSRQSPYLKSTRRIAETLQAVMPPENGTDVIIRGSPQLIEALKDDLKVQPPPEQATSVEVPATANVKVTLETPKTQATGSTLNDYKEQEPEYKEKEPDEKLTKPLGKHFKDSTKPSSDA